MCIRDSSSCREGRGLLAVRRDQKYPWRRQRAIVLIESFVKLYQLNHEPIIWTGYTSSLLDEKLSLFVIIPQLEDNVSDHYGNRS